MKYTVCLLILFLASTAVAQPIIKRAKQHSDVQVAGNNNIVTVIQADGNVNHYDLNRPKGVDSLLKYLQTLPTIGKQINQIFRITKETNKIGKETNDKATAIYDLLKEMANKATNDGLLDTAKLRGEIVVYKKENQRLRDENERLRQQTTDQDYAHTLELANKRLEEYDNEGYQRILNEYKDRERNKIKQAKRDLASASYLQANNNNSTYNYREALLQINEAIDNKSGDEEYLILKANILFNLSRFDESLQDYLSVLGKELNDTEKSDICDRIGQVYYEKGNYDKALEYYGKAITIKEKVLGKEHLITATSYNNIGLVYDEKGDYEKALEYYHKDIAISEKVLGKEHSSTAISYNNIGAVYTEKGDYSKALEYYDKALAICEKILGKEHPNTATYYNNIGGVYDEKGDYDKALKYYQKGLAICEKVFGKEHPSTATSYNNIGGVYIEKGDYDKALEYYDSAINIREKVLGTEHPVTATSYNGIGLVYNEKGDYDKAVEYYDKALIIRENVLGKEHSSTACSYNNIGKAYGEKGEYDRALEYCGKALLICEKVLGKEHLNTATTYNNIGFLNDKKGDYDKALKYYDKTLAIYEKVLGKDHQNTIVSYINIGAVYKEKGDYDKALEYYNKALVGKERTFGKEHQITQNAYFDISLDYMLMNKKEPALSFLEKVTIADNYRKAELINTKGVSYFKKDKYKEAISLYSIAKEMLEKSDTPKTNYLWSALYQNLAKACCYENKKEQALPLFEQALRFCEGLKDDALIERIKKNYADCKAK